MKLVVLLSGRGSNFSAILQAIEQKTLHAQVVAVMSDQADAAGLNIAKQHHIPTHVFSIKDYQGRELFDQAVAHCIDDYHPDLIVLAGYMRILSATFTQKYAGSLINIHPSLLPKYPGLHPHARALANHDQIHGASVHYVTDVVDGGPVIAQASVPVQINDTEETLAARVLMQEHQLYPWVLQQIALGILRWHQGVVYFEDAPLEKPLTFLFK